MFFCGLDIGAATTKAVILNDGRMVSYSVLPTGQSVNLATDKVLEEATRKLGRSSLGDRPTTAIVLTVRRISSICELSGFPSGVSC